MVTSQRQRVAIYHKRPVADLRFEPPAVLVTAFIPLDYRWSVANTRWTRWWLNLNVKEQSAIKAKNSMKTKRTAKYWILPSSVRYRREHQRVLGQDIQPQNVQGPNQTPLTQLQTWLLWFLFWIRQTSVKRRSEKYQCEIFKRDCSIHLSTLLCTK